MKKVKVAASALCLLGVLLGTQVALATQQCANELKIVDKSNANFDFTGICGGGIAIRGNPNLEPGKEFTYVMLGDKAEGEIGYIDNKHHQYINFDYDYTKSGGVVSVKGGEKYYQYAGLCTPYGNEIIIENKQ
ncbi:MAG: hypothetical protein KIT27_00435 [Legionellales bacterium]|nr:hypothetical protein [Legionellales bacterium]